MEEQENAMEEEDVSQTQVAAGPLEEEQGAMEEEDVSQRQVAAGPLEEEQGEMEEKEITMEEEDAPQRQETYSTQENEKTEEMAANLQTPKTFVLSPSFKGPTFNLHFMSPEATVPAGK